MGISRPLQNRVLPTGEIVSHSERGLFTGNRGILPLVDGKLGTSRWKHQHWIICTLTHPRGRYHGPMPERGWTPLFFLDEAVGLAAGHRPCAYCRPDAYRAYKTAWAQATGETSGHADIDRALHQTRVTRVRTQVRHKKHASELPDGAMVQFEGRAHLVHQRNLLAYSPLGYGSRKMLPNSTLTVLTPAPTVAMLSRGFKPFVHPTANTKS